MAAEETTTEEPEELAKLRAAPGVDSVELMSGDDEGALATIAQTASRAKRGWLHYAWRVPHA